MKTGDGVLALLAAKGVCCGLIALSATGAFAGLLDRSIGWIVGGALALGIAAVIWRSGAAKSPPAKTLGAEAAEVRQTGAGAETPRPLR